MPRQNAVIIDEETPLIIRRTLRDNGGDTVTSAAFWRLAALLGGIAVALGAYGEHELKKHVSDQHRLHSWTVAVQYHLVHSVVLLMARHHTLGAMFFLAGIIGFSGSIYAHVLDPETFSWVTPITPFGGGFLILGWLVLVFPPRRAWGRM